MFAARLEQMGRGVPMMASALSTHLAGVQQIVLVLPDPDAGGAAAGRDLVRELAQQYLPFAIALRVDAASRRALAGSLPFVAAMTALDGRATVYICRDFTCRQPVTGLDALQQELKAPA